MEWRAVPGFSNYECTACGQFRSIARSVERGSGSYMKPAVMMNPTKHGGGYRMCLQGDYGVQTVSPQKIVYITFVGEIPDEYGATLIDSSKPASVDNIALRRIGNRYYPESKKHGQKKLPLGMEQGFCRLMDNFLRMRPT